MCVWSTMSGPCWTEIMDGSLFLSCSCVYIYIDYWTVVNYGQNVRVNSILICYCFGYLGASMLHEFQIFRMPCCGQNSYWERICFCKEESEKTSWCLVICNSNILPLDPMLACVQSSPSNCGTLYYFPFYDIVYNYRLVRRISTGGVSSTTLCKEVCNVLSLEKKLKCRAVVVPPPVLQYHTPIPYCTQIDTLCEGATNQQAHQMRSLGMRLKITDYQYPHYQWAGPHCSSIIF